MVARVGLGPAIPLQWQAIGAIAPNGPDYGSKDDELHRPGQQRIPSADIKIEKKEDLVAGARNSLNLLCSSLNLKPKLDP